MRLRCADVRLMNPLDVVLSRHHILFGTDEPVPHPASLRAGPLDVIFVNGTLRHLACRGIEVWHRLDCVFRDPDWWTPPFALDSFTESASGAWRWTGHFLFEPRIDVHARFDALDDGVRLDAEFKAAADVATARTGLCLHYSTALGGVPCEIIHADGRISRSTFPRFVSPWPPFIQIRAFRHRYASGCWATATFSGDTFEFEDQRNNCDPAFKVYSRSNMAARPYRFHADSPVRQSVELRVERLARARAAKSKSVVVRVGSPVGSMPRIGVAVSQDSWSNANVQTAIRTLRPSFLHVDAAAQESRDWPAFAALLRETKASLRLDLALVEDTAVLAQLDELRANLTAAGIAPESLAVFPSSRSLIETAHKMFPDTRIGGGTPHFFAQINRLDEIGAVDFLTFTTSPLVHGADDDSVMGTPHGIPGMVATLRHRFGDIPVRIGPSAIAMRASPLGKHQQTDGTRRIAMASDDPRTRGLFGAAWTLAFVAQCAAAQVEAVTIMALDGPSAVVVHHGTQLAWHPVASVLARLLPVAQRLDVTVSRSTPLVALGLSRGNGRTLLLANPGEAPVSLSIKGMHVADVCVLDEGALRNADASSGPPSFERRPTVSHLTLDSYAVACINISTGDAA